jgi:ribosomal protein L11 methyltransferase
MSFGTGHHATTSMMIRMMSEIDFIGKKIMDFGTGTGVLAILAEKLGASEIIAIDSDDQSIENAAENFDSNGCTKIELIRSSSASVQKQPDIILANIIKIVILDNLSAFTRQLAPGGVILLSGLLKDDEEEIVNKALKYHLKLKKKIEIDNWICLEIIHEFGIN